MDKEKETKTIKTAADVNEFAGKIVFFSVARSCYILGHSTKWPKPEGWEKLNFGYIPPRMSNWGKGEMGYGMSIFKGEEDTASACALLDKTVLQTEFKMREATLEEIQVLHEVYKAGEGSFEYMGWPV